MSYKLLKWNKKSSPTTQELESMFKKRNMDYYSFSNQAGYHYERHSHDYNKFLVLAKGKMKWLIEGNEEILSEGDAVVLLKNTEHEVIVIKNCECWEGHF